MMSKLEQRETQRAEPKGPKDDIGTYAKSINQPTNDIITLVTEKKRILDDIYENVGSQQVTRTKLDFAPPWILKEAWEKEYESNWKDEYSPVSENDVPKNANIITTHSIYKVKIDENGIRTLKGRIVPHGNRDSEKDNIRKDSSTAQLSVIRLLLSVVTFLGLRLASADIKGAYLQRGPIRIDIFVRPPREWLDHTSYTRFTLRKLIKLPYGIVEAGRQWQKTVEVWMLHCYGLERVFWLSQLFVKRDSLRNIILIIAKETDDFLIGGSIRQIKHLTQRLEQRFTVRKIVVYSKFIFNGFEIVQDAVGNIRMSMMRYLDNIEPLELSRTRRKMMDSRATDDELKKYRALAGTLLYLANGALPQTSFVVSLMQQRTLKLRIRHIVDANKMLKELLGLKTWITFKKPMNTEKISY